MQNAECGIPDKAIFGMRNAGCGVRNSEQSGPPHRKINLASAGTKGSMNTLTENNVRLFASSRSWIEGEALRQLYAAAELDGMRLAVGFPDLHPGKGAP